MTHAGVALLATVVLVLTAPVAATASLTATAGTDGVPGASNIVIADNDGSNGRILAAGEYSYVSPDDTRVAVIDYDSDPVNFAVTSQRLALYPTAGGAPTLVIPAPGLGPVVWSPDSTKLATTDDTRTHLLLLDAQTGATTTLATGNFETPSFSPDSTKLAYVQRASAAARGGGTLKIVDLATHTSRTLRAHTTTPVWGPSAIAFSTVTRRPKADLLDIAVIRPDRTHLRRLTHIRQTSTFFGLTPTAWSADGRRLLSGVVGADGEWLNTYGVDAVRGGAHRIARRVQSSAISRDGRYAIGQTGDAECCGFAHTNIVRVPWAGGTRRVLLRHAMFASFYG